MEQAERVFWYNNDNPGRSIFMNEKREIRKKSGALHFADLYRIFRPKILRYLKGMVGEADADDLTQEVFIKVSQGLQNFKGRSQVSTWIYRIATNAAIDRLRQRTLKRHSTGGAAGGSSSGRTEIDAGDPESCADEKDPTAETSLIRDEMYHCLRSFIDKLPAGQRAVVGLSFFEGLKNAEIAKVLGINIQTVKMRRQRARSRLIVELRAHCGWFRDARNHLTWDGKIIR